MSGQLNNASGENEYEYNFIGSVGLTVIEKKRRLVSFGAGEANGVMVLWIGAPGYCFASGGAICNPAHPIKKNAHAAIIMFLPVFYSFENVTIRASPECGALRRNLFMDDRHVSQHNNSTGLRERLVRLWTAARMMTQLRRSDW